MIFICKPRILFNTMSFNNTIPSARFLYNEFSGKYPNVLNYILQRYTSIFQLYEEKYDSKKVPIISIDCAGYLSSVVMLNKKKIIVYCPSEFNIPNSEYLVIVRKL